MNAFLPLNRIPNNNMESYNFFKMKTTRCVICHFIIGSTFITSGSLHAQHYPTGSEGIKAGSSPAPGFSAEDGNSFYYADKATGTWSALSDFSEFNYVQTPRLAWVSDWKILGANYGAAVRVPIAYKEISFKAPPAPPGLGAFPGQPGTSSSGTVTVHEFGLTDIEIEPVMLSWQLKHFDIKAGYSVWAPTGDHDVNTFYLIRLGEDCWTHVFTLGSTWYPDTEKTWAVSILGHYEINTEQFLQSVPAPGSATVSQYDTLGDTFTLEWAASKTIFDGLDIGLSGYYQQQVTDTQLPSSISHSYLNELVDVAGVGPEVDYALPKWGLTAALRYAYEFTSNDRPQGNQITLVLKKTF